MNESTPFSGMSQDLPPRAVSLYQEDTTDEFPVLKAFQQYIDAEQAKARKRLLSLGIFFGLMMLAVIAVFVSLLIAAGERNQKLNDRLVEFAMKERQTAQPVVVQPPAPQVDNTALLKFTSKIEDLQAKLLESQRQAQEAEKAAQTAKEEAAAKAARAARGPSPEELEIQRLKALLTAQKEQAEAEKKRKREEELEAYRRKHYPEFYQQKLTLTPNLPVVQPRKGTLSTRPAPLPADQDLDDDGALTYFDTDDDEDDLPVARPLPKVRKNKQSPSPVVSPKPQAVTTVPAPVAVSPKPADPYTIPVEVKGTRLKWRVPQD